VYAGLGSDAKAVVIHSRLNQSEYLDRFEEITTRKRRIIICVDMFGEGFDLPNLKIAAIHDVHKSLAITLQFIGRFVRSASNVGDASVVVNIFDQRVASELQSLYAQDADWNILLRRQSEGTIQKELTLQETVYSFSGELTRQVPLWNLRPAFSTIVYKTDCSEWTPAEFEAALPQCERKWTAISHSKNMTAAVLAVRDEVRWGRYRDIRDLIWNLVIAYWDEDKKLLFMFASDYDIIRPQRLAAALCGDSATMMAGEPTFRIFGNVERPMIRNLGASKSGTIRYTMYFGPDVAVGLTDVERAESELNNLFGWGYENGEKVSFGCSSR